MAAAQPFISGAISKTINMPNQVTIEEIEESYMLSAELGLKAMALYRDGSKASQPLSVTADEANDDEEEEEGLAEALEDEARVTTGVFAPGVSPTQAYAGVSRPRFLLPGRRGGFTQEARIGGHKVFVRTGEYADGTIGELFIDLAKEGATLRGILSCFAIAVSKGLQYGVPLEEFVDTFTFHTFEPRGMVEGHPNIKMSNSIVDYVFRALGMEYLGRNDLVQVPPTDDQLPSPPKGLVVDAGQQLELTESQKEADIDAQMTAAAFVDGNGSEPMGGNGDGSGHRDARSPNGQKRGVNLAEKVQVKVGANAPAATTVATQADPMASALGDLMGDAPLCETCGHITVRNGSCYRCLNCGNSMGCS
jgi:ribonucleoside-diphosphate reductase alpha chain